MNGSHLERAQALLASLRRGAEQYALLMRSFRAEVRDGGLSLADLGTSEEELKELELLGLKTAALGRLEFLRKGTTHYEDFLRYLREEAEKAGLSLVDLGTDEEELKRLRVLGCKTTALGWLQHLRKGIEQHEAFFEYFRQEVEKGGLSLTDLGTSEEELEKLRLLGRKVAHNEWLRGLHENYPGQYDGSPSGFRRVVSALSSLWERVKRGLGIASKSK
ncbi:hypothetical protein KBB27_02730 [Patescibacteria group bacterium]|nr:hypothetical protein [Patescibacteria group bacterium]